MENHPYEGPKIEDYGDLLSITQANQHHGTEDGAAKSPDHVSNGQQP